MDDAKNKKVNRVVVNGEVIFDITHVTVTPETLFRGVTAYDASGALIVGTYDPPDEK